MTSSPVPLPEPASARRLIVLVPDAELDYTPVVHRVWELANALGSRVQFFGLCSDATEEWRLRRELITLAALTQNSRVSADVKIEFGNSWVKAVKSNWQNGDVIVCFSEHRVGILQHPLSQVLETNLYTKVHVMTGFQAPERPHWHSKTVVWAGSLGIIGGFFWAQMKLTQLPQDWAHTTLLYLSLIVEVGVILLWNSLF